MRFVFPVFLLLAGLVVAVSVLLYLAYGASTVGAQDAALARLAAPVYVSVDEGQVTRVSASSEVDAYRALGYVQASRNAWTLVLLRQTASGRVSEWFGSATLPLDRFTRMLGLADAARAAYQGLEQADREVLDAYAGGVRAAFARQSVRNGDPFALLNVSVEPWEPWHSILLERFLNWIACTPLEVRDSVESQDLGAFLDGDRLLRSWVHMHHLEQSLLWVRPASDETTLFVRLVTGDAALPLLEEVILSWPGNVVWGVTFPGWPALWVGRSDSVAWGFLPTGHVAHADSLDLNEFLQTRHERIRYAPDGDEELVVTREGETLILVGRGVIPNRPDSLFDIGITWPGRRAPSDWPMFRNLAAGNSPGPVPPSAFNGAMVPRGGGVRHIGEPPPPVHSTPSITLISRSRFVDDMAAGLASYAVSGDPASAAAGVRSRWAARVTPGLVELARRNAQRLDAPIYRSALGYLEAWDFRFDGSSIGGTIFDRWSAALGGVRFRRWEADSTGTETARALRDVVDGLAAEFGPDLTLWRWEDTQPSLLYFPVWSSSLLSEAGLELPASRLYGPLRAPRAGHPSTLAWGPTADTHAGPAPAVWSGWISTGQWNVVSVTARPLRSGGFLSRSRGTSTKTIDVVDVDQGVKNEAFTLSPTGQ